MTLQIFDFLYPISFYLCRNKLCITTTFQQRKYIHKTYPGNELIEFTSHRISNKFVERVKVTFTFALLVLFCLGRLSSYMYLKKHYASNDVPLKALWHLMYHALPQLRSRWKRNYCDREKSKYYPATINPL